MPKIARDIIGIFDADTRLVSTQHSFNIETKTKKKKKAEGGEEEVWYSKYYYSDIQSAIRGYAKYKAKILAKETPKSKQMKDILELVEILDQTIKDVGIRLEEAFRTCNKFDPVEDSCRE